MLLRFGGILFVAMLAIWLYCLLDAITSDETQVRSLPKVLWVLILLFTFEVGVVLWLLLGRPRQADRPAGGSASRADRRDPWSGWPRTRGRAAGGPGGTAGPGAPGGPGGPGGPDPLGTLGAPSGRGGRNRPAPDDDPEFLARLKRQADDDHEQLLGRWEADLRRREEELRRRDDGDGDVPRSTEDRTED